MSDKNGNLDDGSYAVVNEDTSHQLTCDVKDTRPAAQISWEIDDARPGSDFVIGTPSTMIPPDGLIDTTSTLTVSKVERKHHRMKAACISEISVDQKPPAITTSVWLDVHGKNYIL